MKIKTWSSLLLTSALVFALGQIGASAGEMLPKEPTDDTRGAFCNMVVYQKDHEMGKYAAQMLTADGKSLFFDDIGCLFNYKRSMSTEPTKMWVRDYNTLEWISLNQATVVTADIKTPMQYGFAFFKSKESAEKFVESNKQLEAEIVEWKLVDQLAQKRLEMKMQKGQHMNNQMHAAQEITVMIDGEKQTFAQAPMIMAGRTLVPLRGVFEKLGAKVEWDASTKTVQAIKEGTTITLKVDAKTATVNNKEVNLDTAAKIHNSHTMVPVRFISEALGAQVTWNNKTRTVMIHQ